MKPGFDNIEIRKVDDMVFTRRNNYSAGIGDENSPVARKKLKVAYREAGPSEGLTSILKA